jgi:hypothetical protein
MKVALKSDQSNSWKKSAKFSRNQEYGDYKNSDGLDKSVAIFALAANPTRH